MILTHEPTQSLILHADDPFRIRGLLRQSRTLPRDDYNVAAKWTFNNVRILRNIGIAAPLPPYDYPGRFPPYDHQKQMAEFQVLNQKCFNLSDPGTMKTAATLWAADMLMNWGVIKKAAIFCPLSCTKEVWINGIFEAVVHRRGVIVHGGQARRKKMLAADVDFYVINHDGISMQEVYDAVHDRPDIGLVVIDEGSLFRNSDTDRYKLLRGMLRRNQYLWWLTGGPCPKAPTDVWAQARVVNPKLVPEYFGQFRKMTMTEVSKFRWLPKPGAKDMAYAALKPAIRFKKADCVSLPPVVTIPLAATLSSEQAKHLKEMQTTMSAMIANKQVTAVNAADKLIKVRQILCGQIKNGDGSYTDIPHGPRLKVLTDCIDGAGAKTIVIIPFKGITYVLEKELIKLGYTPAVVNGDVPAGKRNRIFTNFKTEVDPHDLLCHPEVMAHGLNLTEADTLISYAPIDSHDQWSQVIERFNRKGQTRKMTIFRIAAHPVEWQMYRNLDSQAAMQTSILDMFKEVAQA